MVPPSSSRETSQRKREAELPLSACLPGSKLSPRVLGTSGTPTASERGRRLRQAQEAQHSFHWLSGEATGPSQTNEQRSQPRSSLPSEAGGGGTSHLLVIPSFQGLEDQSGAQWEI